MAAIINGFDHLPTPHTYDYWCEPGRALVAECASVVVRVDLRKGDRLYINDGAFGSLFDAGTTLNWRFPVRMINAKPHATLKPFSFYGPTCTSEDFMPGPFMLPASIKEGDYIEIGQTGAYGNVMRTGFNGFGAYETIAVQSPPLMSLFETKPAKKRKLVNA